MQSLNVSYSSFGKHTCTRIPSSEGAIKKIKTLQQVLQLLVFLNLLLPLFLSIPQILHPRYLLTLSPQNNMEHVLAVQRE